ncbi:MAG: aldolase/citrate lyase family protein [Verrucomicrobiae bacterium]|nr:aldolase/citrate lyase family protein [Verrucomicrobiae bacterium]
MKNSLRVNLLNRRLTVGGWLQIGHPACAEVLAGAGFDWLCVDLEHGAIDLETTASIFRAVDAFDCVPMARQPARHAKPAASFNKTKQQLKSPIKNC